MATPLETLVKRFPPPVQRPSVDWAKLESTIGVEYPSDFKEFVDAYGFCTWFEHLSLFLCEAKDEEDLDGFQAALKNKIEEIEEMDDEFEFPLYPADDGCFPFMVDFNGTEYLWHRNGAPDTWEIVAWQEGITRIAPAMPIPSLILRWMEGDALLEQVLGSSEYTKMYPGYRVHEGG